MVTLTNCSVQCAIYVPIDMDAHLVGFLLRQWIGVGTLFTTWPCRDFYSYSYGPISPFLCNNGTTNCRNLTDLYHSFSKILDLIVLNDVSSFLTVPGATSYHCEEDPYIEHISRSWLFIHMKHCLNLVQLVKDILLFLDV